jgi:hypothetical protein
MLIASNNLVYSEPIYLPEPGYKSSKKDKYSGVKLSDNVPVLTVYPNPAHEYFIAEYYLQESEIPAVLAISDVTGKKVREIFLKNNSDVYIVRTNDLPNGLYLVSLTLRSKSVATAKITIAK